MSRLKFKKSSNIFFTGFFGLLIGVSGFFYLMNAEQLSARLFIKKTINKLNVAVPVVVENTLQAKVSNVSPIDGMIVRKHPRIILPQLMKWDGLDVPVFITQRIAEQKKNKSYLNSCRSNSFMSLVTCWLTTNEEQILETLTQQMLAFKLNQPTAATTYSNGWQLALAYDLIFPALNEKQKKIIEDKISQALNATLINLDEESASLWHGRSSHAAIAWLCAVVLSDRVNGFEVLQDRAQSHFLNAIDALTYTAVWPEGYNYWIQNRAFLLALASSAYLNGLVDATQAKKVKHVMRQVAYWTVYATRPDNSIEGFGDEGSRVDLKDETRRVIDLIVQMTRDPVLAGYSNYLARLHGRTSYYRAYHWGFLLFNDPSVKAVGDGTMASLGRHLPKTRLFGEKTSNYAYLRSGWGEDDTFVSFKAGHTFTHHGHYDAGHFTIFKGEPLAINSSTYKGFFAPHRLNYAIRTIAKNSLLIQKPDEKVKPNRHFKANVADGGQRITMPTGSAVLSVANWFENYKQGKHYEGAELLNFGEKENEYTYISSNLTPAYNNSQYDENNDGGKVSEAIRQLLYLPVEDHVIVFDRVTTSDPEYQKKWLLHTVNKPKVEALTVLKGNIDNGILESHSDKAIVENGRGFLTVKTVYPEQSIMRLVGGKDYQYYVETDADDRVLDGINYKQGSSINKWHDVGMWRIEVQPKILAKHDRFLIVMSPSLDEQRHDFIEKISVQQKNIIGVTTENSVIIFAPEFGSNEADFTISHPKQKLLIVGLSIFNTVKLLQNGKTMGHTDVKNGVAFYQSDESFQGKIKLQW